ncbi:MAG: type II toxin-antitoxin system Phd/YefM family antitoxin [Chloroflexota bacterium]
MPLKYLPATEVKNRFGRVLREVTKTGGPIYVERDGKPVAVILSVREYERTRRAALPADRSELARAAFGMWAGRADISADWVNEGRARWESDWQGDDAG